MDLELDLEMDFELDFRVGFSKWISSWIFELDLVLSESEPAYCYNETPTNKEKTTNLQ